MNQYRVDYEIKADGTVVQMSYVELPAATEDAAAEKAVTWVHDNDPRHDPRIDPIVTITGVEEIDYEVHNVHRFVIVVIGDGEVEVRVLDADGTHTVIATFPSLKDADRMASVIRKALRTWSGWY